MRVIKPELLDDADPIEARPSLVDLTKINKYLGGYRVLRKIMASVASPRESFSVLDIGAASGDMGRKIRLAFPKAQVTAFDYRVRHLALAEPPKIVGDAFRMPFRARSFDVVFCSLFLHHFEDRQVVELLSAFGSIARRAVCAIDLDRGPFSYHFIPATRWLFGWHPITLHDAPASVAAGFKRVELEALAKAAGLREPRVAVHRPWGRLSLVGQR
ncbi:MAG TPA: methyltransferase domain-containing protein [Bryobacteraceae bacterium]|nr:methyltransferase domain-containing protein [Bryobacteraceae bacterium]